MCLTVVHVVHYPLFYEYLQFFMSPIVLLVVHYFPVLYLEDDLNKVTMFCQGLILTLVSRITCMEKVCLCLCKTSPFALFTSDLNGAVLQEPVFAHNIKVEQSW